MKISEIMTSGTEFLDGGATIREAAEMMGELDVGALPIGSAEEILGVITDRDILYRLVARGLDATATTAAEIMTTPVIACDVDDTVSGVMDAMASHHIRRMPVQDARGRVVGWVTLADLSRKLLLDSGALQGFMHALTEKA